MLRALRDSEREHTQVVVVAVDVAEPVQTGAMDGLKDVHGFLSASLYSQRVSIPPDKLEKLAYYQYMMGAWLGSPDVIPFSLPCLRTSRLATPDEGMTFATVKIPKRFTLN